jgi:hypothetical protein
MRILTPHSHGGTSKKKKKTRINRALIQQMALHEHKPKEVKYIVTVL